MLNRTMGYLHHAGHWPAIRATEVVSPATSTFATFTCVEPAPVRGHCVDWIYGRFRIRELVKMCSDRPGSCEIPTGSSKVSTMQLGGIYEPKPRAVTSITYYDVRVERHSREAMPV
jgi:hypothetical protein